MKVQDYYGQSDRELAQRYVGGSHSPGDKQYYEAALQHRYHLYQEIPEIASFASFAGRDVLEIGTGQGADHYMFSKYGTRLYGIDITEKHCRMTREFLKAMGKDARVSCADACALPFPSDSFDHVYSCGVLLLVERIDHALAEIRRVLRPGGTTTIMLYNKNSIHYWIKTRLYYGWVLNENALWGRDTVVDWYTDGIGYPKTYHYRPQDLPRLFRQFSRVEYRVTCLTPEQVPEIGLPKDDALRQWVEKRFGFYLWVKATT